MSASEQYQHEIATALARISKENIADPLSQMLGETEQKRTACAWIRKICEICCGECQPQSPDKKRGGGSLKG